MHIEDIFEDLEAQFAAATEQTPIGCFTAGAKAIELKTGSMVPRELIAPIIGVDFMAGLDAVHPIWHIFPMRIIQRVIFYLEGDPQLPKLRNFEIEFAKFVQALPMPCSIRWRVGGNEDFVRSGQLHSASPNLLFIYTKSQTSPIAVPIAALEQLSIESVDNLNGDF